MGKRKAIPKERLAHFFQDGGTCHLKTRAGICQLVFVCSLEGESSCPLPQTVMSWAGFDLQCKYFFLKILSVLCTLPDIIVFHQNVCVQVQLIRLKDFRLYMKLLNGKKTNITSVSSSDELLAWPDLKVPNHPETLTKEASILLVIKVITASS